MVVSTPVPGPVLVRVRYSRDWQLTSGRRLYRPGPGPRRVSRGVGRGSRWSAPVAERFTLRVSSCYQEGMGARPLDESLVGKARKVSVRQSLWRPRS